MYSCRLDTLPVELLHQLLTYFSAHEIFSTFTNVTSYIDAVLAAYTNYRVNFKAITRSHFDLVCQHMRPDQVVALTLSDDEDTPGLIGLFLSRFQINLFVHLQSLRLLDIGAEFWESIIIPMTKLKYLRSFRFFSPDRNEQWVCNLSGDALTQLDRSLFDSYASILPQLYQLRLYHGDFLDSVQFPHLRHLVLERSTVYVMKQISVAAPQLQSLDTSFSLYAMPTDLIYPMDHLSFLVLRIDGSRVSMNAFEQMMFNLPRLKHLQLIADCNDDVIDGQRWQTKVKDLVALKFKFRVSSRLQSQQLNSFRTSFWLEEKRWFVVYANGYFFSVPHFITTEANENFRLPQYTTVPDRGIFYESIDKVQLTKTSGHLNHHFPHVHTLTLHSAPPRSTIKKVVDLRQIQNLVLSSLKKNFPVKPVIYKMPNLCKISIEDNVKNLLKQVRHIALDKIRTLEISEISMHVNGDTIEQLSAVFPDVRHLHVNHECSSVQILDFLKRFKYLSTASFHCISSYDNDKYVQQSRLNIQFILYDQMRCVEGLDYTYRFDRSRVYVWIGSQFNRDIIRTRF